MDATSNTAYAIMFVKLYIVIMLFVRLCMEMQSAQFEITDIPVCAWLLQLLLLYFRRVYLGNACLTFYADITEFGKGFSMLETVYSICVCSAAV